MKKGSLWTLVLKHIFKLALSSNKPDIFLFLDHMSIGALGDSFYEYLLKAWLQSNKEDNEARQMFDDSMTSIFQHMLKTSPNGLMYFAELKFDRPEHKMDHLACFSGKLFQCSLFQRTMAALNNRILLYSIFFQVVC